MNTNCICFYGHCSTTVVHMAGSRNRWVLVFPDTAEPDTVSAVVTQWLCYMLQSARRTTSSRRMPAATTARPTIPPELCQKLFFPSTPEPDKTKGTFDSFVLNLLHRLCLINLSGSGLNVLRAIMWEIFLNPGLERMSARYRHIMRRV